MTERFKKPIRPGEKRQLIYDFSDDLATGETLSGTPTIAFDTAFGTDASPNLLANGSASIDTTGTMIIVPVIGRTDGCDYGVAVTCSTTNSFKAPSLRAVLSVRS
jgi:hypothetical protein